MKSNDSKTGRSSAAADPLELLRRSGAVEIDRRLMLASQTSQLPPAGHKQVNKVLRYRLVHYGTRAAVAVLAVGIISWSAIGGIRSSKDKKVLSSEISRFVEDLYTNSINYQLESGTLQSGAADSLKDFIDALYIPQLESDW